MHVKYHMDMKHLINTFSESVSTVQSHGNHVVPPRLYEIFYIFYYNNMHY